MTDEEYKILKSAIADIAACAKETLIDTSAKWNDIDEVEPEVDKQVLLLMNNGDVVVGYRAIKRYYPSYGAFRREWANPIKWAEIPAYRKI